MDTILKAAVTLKAAGLDEDELALINTQTLRKLSADEVFVFRLAACNTVVDRDKERFTENALEQMAKLYPGKPVLMDHKWSANAQTARVYAAEVAPMGEGEKQLMLRCYMPRTEGTAEVIASIESGVLRECSVGLCVSRVLCSICGMDQTEALCTHRQGRVYNGVKCHMDLDEVYDVYEVSLCAVPAQPDAGVAKAKRYGGTEMTDIPGEDDPEEDEVILAQARMTMEGGN